MHWPAFWYRNFSPVMLASVDSSDDRTLQRNGLVFIRSSAGAYVDANGRVQLAAQDTARFTALAGVPDGIVLETTRVNLALQSEALGNAAWTPSNATVQTNQATGPDGNVSAEQLVEDATAGVTHFIQSTTNIAVVSGSRYTTSVYAKAGARTWIALQQNQVVTPTAYFNLLTGALGSVSGTGSPTAGIEPIGNGWYRCWLSWTATGTAIARHVVYSATADGVVIYDGNGVSGVLLWGAQMELGDNVSTYIVTGGGSVSRGADGLWRSFAITPQSMTAYVRFRERGTINAAIDGERVFNISGAAQAARFEVFSSSSKYTAQHRTPITFVQSTMSTAPAYGDVVELRAVLYPDGSVQIGQSINEAAEVLAARSAALAFAEAWDATPRLQIAARTAGLGSAGVMDLKLLKIAKDVRNLDYMRKLSAGRT